MTNHIGHVLGHRLAFNHIVIDGSSEKVEKIVLKIVEFPVKLKRRIFNARIAAILGTTDARFLLAIINLPLIFTIS